MMHRRGLTRYCFTRHGGQERGSQEARNESDSVPVQDVLNAPQFGTGTQTLRPLDELQQGPNRLS